jgi:DNA-binding transcriptional regulator/RsmH inhibitor MraZ
MSHLTGEFNCKLDAKGRMMIPAGLKIQLPEAEKEGLMIKSIWLFTLNLNGTKDLTN